MKMTGNMKGNVTRTFFKIKGTLAVWNGAELVDEDFEYLGKTSSQGMALSDIREANPDKNIVSMTVSDVQEVTMKVPIMDFLKMAMNGSKVLTDNFGGMNNE